MDGLYAAWDELARWIADPRESDASPGGFGLDSPDAAGVRGVLDAFWDEVHAAPARALLQTETALAVADAHGVSPVLRAELSRRQATALFSLGRSAESARVLEAGIALLDGVEDVGEREGAAAVRAAILGFLGNAHLAQGRVPRALVALEEAIAIARANHMEAPLGVYLSSLGNARIFVGDADSAEEYYLEGLRIARKHRNREGEAVNLGNLGLVRQTLGDPDGAEHYYREALELARELGDRRSAATLEANLGLVCAERGELEEATRSYQNALTLARALGDRATEAMALVRQAGVARELGAFQQATELADHAEACLAEVGDPRRGSVWNERGRVQLELGDAEEARAFFERALEAATGIGDRRGEAVAHYDLGRSASQLGHPAEAMGHFQRALVVARDLGDRDVDALVQIARAEALLVMGDTDGAEAALESAADRASARKGSLLEARYQLGRALALARTQPERARTILGETLIRARERGFKALASEAERLEGGLAKPGEE